MLGLKNARKKKECRTLGLKNARKTKEKKMVKLKFHVDFFSTSDAATCKSRIRNSSFILELEF